MVRLINQETNYASEFGAVFRSSAIFYKPKNIKTTVSFSNYWEFKNRIKVGIVITTRDIKGKLVSREEISFGESNVINYEILSIDEGALEIEAFSNVNLRIPYAAIMVVYESRNSVSMVHSYGRNHSLIEIEDENAIVEARESCWSLRLDEHTSSKAVFHNGHIALDAQDALFIVSRADGAEKNLSFKIPPIKKFETFIFDPEKIYPKIRDFLSNMEGWGTLHFNSKSSFTRLLVLWENSKNGEIQVTHSNFDYSSHETNMIDTLKPAYMSLPVIYGIIPNVIVYPKFSNGKYTVNNKEFSSGIVIKNAERNLIFRRKDGQLPARIVTAISEKINEKVNLPFECSLGVVHEKRPPKRFHWFIVSSKMTSVIHLTAFKDLFPLNRTIELVCRLYSDVTKSIKEKSLSFETLDDLPDEIKVADIFDLSEINSFGYVSIFSQYGGLVIYSSLRKEDSVTIEHSF